MRRPHGLNVLALGMAAAILSGCGGAISRPSITTTAPGGVSEQIPVTPSKPDGAGPFPALAIVHDCRGLGPRSSGAPARWARERPGRGCGVLIPGSFTTRGLA